MLNRTVVLIPVLLLTIAGCTQNTIYRSDIKDRPDMAPLDCMKQAESTPDPAEERRKCQTHSIERTKEYTLFFIELDEQGRFYDDRQLLALSDYLAQVERKNAEAVSKRKNGATGTNVGEVDLSIVAFVHGWRHNAEYDDSNVDLARETLRFTYDGEAAEPHPNPSARPREVVGVYIGWRGLSTSVGANKRNGLLEYLLTPWELISVFDRKYTAQNVAVGSVREVFSLLRAYQESANAIVKSPQDPAIPPVAPASAGVTPKPEVLSRCLDPQFINEDYRAPFHCKRVRLMIIGHSFGGLMVFNAISGSLMDSVARGMMVAPTDLTCRDEFSASAGDASAIVSSYADLIVLVNPAVEGARFEALHQAVARRARIEPGNRGAFCPNQRPVLVSITSEYDYATLYAFRVARWINTTLESTSPISRGGKDDAYTAHEEYVASINTMGHVKRFHTHSLKSNARWLNEWRERRKRGEAGNEMEDAYLESLDGYCVPGKTQDRAEELLHACRCNPGAWWTLAGDYLKERDRNPNKVSCPAYVEELNAAEMFTGGGRLNLPWVPAAKPSVIPGKDISGRQFSRAGNWMRSYCGGATLQHIPAYENSKGLKDPNLLTLHSASSPVWNVYSHDREIIAGHSDLQKRAFKSMLQQMYHAITVRDGSAGSFIKLGKDARERILKHCAVAP